MQTMTAAQIAAWVDGQLIGENVSVNQVGTLLTGQKNAIGFLADEKYRHQLADTQLGLVLLASPEENFHTSQIITSDVRRAWRMITERFQQARDAMQVQGIHPQAIIAPDAQIGAGVSIGAGAVIESAAVIADGARIEALAYIGAGVQIGAQTRVGQGVKILSGTTIG